MTRSRFEDILRCIHLVDNKSIISNQNDPTYDKIAKTRWLVEAHNELCGQFYNAKQNLCGWNDDKIYWEILTHPTYIKVKPCRYGMKIWCLVDAKSKFVQKMEVSVLWYMS
jgi:hypothetical protein